MNPETINKRFAMYNDLDTKESFKNWQEKDKLSLRKKRIFDTLTTKRQIMSKLTEKQSSIYAININEISKNEEIKNNPELYIKTKFDIKKWFKFLFSSNINEVKEALFIIELYIQLQINEIDIEKRVLSRNDTELINCLCDYLNHQDKQIAFYACCCLINLSFFPKHIESRLYSDRNFNKVLTFVNKNDFGFGNYLLYLLINYNSNPKGRKYFFDHGIFERINYLIKTNLDKLETKNYIYLIKLINVLFKNFYEDEEEYSNEQKKNLTLPMLSFIKNTTKNSFVNNPWASYEDSQYYLEIISFYAKLGADLKDSQILMNIINDDFCKVLLDFYYKLKDSREKIILMKTFVNLLSLDDSINEIFIEEGILYLLLNEINNVGYNNFKLLDLILYACSNIAGGNQGQIEQMYLQGLAWKIMDIAQDLSKQNNLNAMNKKIIFNCIYCLSEIITGSSNVVKIEIMIYQDFEIIKLFAFAIKNILDENNKIILLEFLSDSIYNLIKCGQSDMDLENLNQFKNKLISNGIEDIITNYSVDKSINKDINAFFNLIYEFLHE